MLPRCNSRLTPASARTPPKDLRMSVSLSSGVCTGGRSSEHLRVLADVADVVDEGFAHRADAIGAEGHFTHASHVDGFVRIFTAREPRGDLRDRVAQIHGVPDRELWHHAFLDVTDELGRQAETGDLDLAREPLVLDGTRRGHDAHRADAHEYG